MGYDLLLINTHRQYDLSTGFQCDWLGIYQLATWMEWNGFPARAFAGYAHEIPPLLERELPTGVSVVGFSCDYENREEVAQLSRLVRERCGLPVIVGGPQAIALGKPFLEESRANVIVRGEGELPLLALMQYFMDGSGSLETIPGIVFLEDGEERRTPLPAPIMDLDSLPPIDPALVLDRRFRASTASILTARGCPFRCSFCYEGGNTRSVRWRSIENVMAELRQALDANPSIHFVLFTDDTFTLNAARVRAFCEALEGYRNQRDFCWFAEAHPQTLLKHPDLVPLMVRAGLGSLQIGIESGNAHILKAYNKKTTPALIEDTVALCHSADVPHLVGNIIVGGAHETEESIAASCQFGLRLLDAGAGMLELHAVHFWPLPFTAMTTRPGDFGMEILDPQSRTAVTDYPVVRCGALGPERLSEARDQMAKQFHDRIFRNALTLPPARIERVLRYWRRYGLHSAYVEPLLNVSRFRRFCLLRENGAIVRSEEIPAAEIGQWHPQRQCQPLSVDGKYFADDLAIDEEAFRVLVASAGRMTVAEAARHCELDKERFLDVARRLENDMALAFCRY